LPQPFTTTVLAESFRSLGILSGARLIVHSALRQLGPVDGGADAVLDALLTCIGPTGLLAVPTFTYFNEVFDPAETPGRTGILTETARLRSNAVRSLHPTHSVAAIGQGAEALVAGHERLPGLGIDSPLDRLAKDGGGILLLGVGHTSNSTVHVGEAHAGVCYADIPFHPDRPKCVTVRGATPMEIELRDPPGCSRAFGAVEAELRRMGAIRDGMIGKALVQWMPGQSVIDAAVRLLRHNEGALLCSDPGCYRCSSARRRIAERQS
jgi:aminoglycoside 3-N-acetyltransferase